jgi:hypothetical protein
MLILSFKQCNVAPMLHTDDMVLSAHTTNILLLQQMLPAGIGKTTKNFHLLKQNAVYMKQE